MTNYFTSTNSTNDLCKQEELDLTWASVKFYQRIRIKNARALGSAYFIRENLQSGKNPGFDLLF